MLLESLNFHNSIKTAKGKDSCCVSIQSVKATWQLIAQLGFFATYCSTVRLYIIREMAKGLIGQYKLPFIVLYLYFQLTIDFSVALYHLKKTNLSFSQTTWRRVSTMHHCTCGCASAWRLEFESTFTHFHLPLASCLASWLTLKMWAWKGSAVSRMTP